MRVAAALLSALILVGTPGLATAQRVAGSGADDEKRISMRFVRADLRQILMRVAPLLGERIIYDTGVSGRVTIAVPRPVSRAEAWELLHAALALKGFVATPVASGGYKIVPAPEASASDPWTLEAPIPDSESRIVTLVPLHNIGVAELREVLTPLLDAQTLAIPAPDGASLILGTTQRRLGAILRLAKELDVRPLRDLEIATLTERDASIVAEMLEAKYGELRGGKPIVEVWIDERSNSVLYRAPRTLFAEVRALIEQVDQPVTGSGEIRVIPLSYADAEEVANILQELSAAPGGTGPSQRSGLAGAQLNVVADPATASLVVNASTDTLQRVRAVVRELDRPPRQVALDAVVVEWVYDDDMEFRLVGASQFDAPNDFLGAVQVLPSPFVGQGQPPLDSLTVDVVRGLNRINVVAEAQSTIARTLMKPHVVALSGEEQVFFSGNEIPVETAAVAEDTTNSLLQRSTIERRDVGIELRVRPTVGNDFDTQLEVEIAIEDVSGALFQGASGPTFTRRDIHTVAQLQPGAAMVIGSFSQPFQTKSRLGIPFLMDIPFFGNLFAQTQETTKRSHIVIAVQARPLPDSRARIANSIRRRVALERALAREEPLPAASSGHFALRVATEPIRARADALAQQLDSELHPANVLRWTPDLNLPPTYDVQLLGFDSYEAATEEAFRLYGEGFDADVLVLSGAAELLD